MTNSHIYRFIKEEFRSFISNTQGVSAIIIALLAIPVFGAIGLSVDLGRAYVVKSKLATALDAAGLAAGRNIFANDAEIYADAQKYFDANFPVGYMGTAPVIMDANSITWDETRQVITLNVDADISTTFMNVLNFPTLTVGANTAINRENRGMELIMVLDNTGSMNYNTSGTKRIVTLKKAAKNLVDILYGDDETKEKLWIGVVPYTTQVNVGPQNINFVPTADRDNILSNATSIFTADNNNNTALGRDVDGNGGHDTVYGWKGCVEMRDDLNGGIQDLSDDPPANDFIPYFYTSDEAYDGSNKWASNGVSGSRGPNKYCPPPILPLTSEKTAIKAHIDTMETSGATAVNIGLIWGWRTISPQWNGRWYDSSTLNLPSGYTALPLNYGEDYMDKVVILMTDGENTLGQYGIYHAYGRQKEVGIQQGDAGYNSLYHASGEGVLTASTSTSAYIAMDDAKTAQSCTNMKAAGIIIYTVIFVSGNETLFSNCATSPKHYFKAATADDLIDNFNSIGEELSNLRISK